MINHIPVHQKRRYGLDGDDTITAENGRCLIESGSGNNIIDVSKTRQNSKLYGGSGNDILNGGEGNDVYYFGRGSGKDTIVEIGNDNTIKLGPGVGEKYLIMIEPVENIPTFNFFMGIKEKGVNNVMNLQDI